MKQETRKEIVDLLRYVEDMNKEYEGLERSFPESKSFMGAKTATQEIINEIERRLNSTQPD